MITFYKHYNLVPTELWPCRHFRPVEIACRSDGSILLNMDALSRLETARVLLDKPMRINSGYRTENYNKKIGGKPHSMHLQGRAFDVSLIGHDRDEVLRSLKAAGFTGFGFYDTFIHADTGPERLWDGRTIKGDQP